MKLCSACLLGVRCRFDGNSKPNKKVIELSKKETLVPVCPEQLAGFPTPREQTEQKQGMVFSKSGKDLTEMFEKGAQETLKIARLLNINEAILKQRSASCGSGQVYDGTFSGEIINGNGITAALLKKNNIKVISEEDL